MNAKGASRGARIGAAEQKGLAADYFAPQPIQIPRMTGSFSASRGVRWRPLSSVAACVPRLGGMTRPTDEVLGAVTVEVGPPPVPV